VKNIKEGLVIGGFFMLFLFFLPTILGPMSSISIGAEPFLGDRHKSRGLDCDQCHKENPPQKATSPKICISCHGDASQMTEKTKKANPNPHYSPHFEIDDCTSCHRAHKNSEDQCAQCHNYGFKVP